MCHSYRVILALAFRRIVAVAPLAAPHLERRSTKRQPQDAKPFLNELGLDEPVDLVEELVYVIDGSGGESMFTSTVLVGIDGLTAPHIVLPSVFGTRLQIGQRS